MSRRGSAIPLPDQIRAAIEQTATTATRAEIQSSWNPYVRVGVLQAEIDRMVEAGELVDLGVEPVRPYDGRADLGPRRLYGLPGLIHGFLEGGRKWAP